jgi:hypothetical protein
MSPILDDEYDLNRIIIRPLYFGLVVNILVPMGLLLICWYFENQQSWYNRIGESANTLFYVFGLLAIAQAGLALWWRGKMMNQPMIRRKETFEDDFAHSLLSRSKPIFLTIAGISLYGIVYFYLTARFKETVFLVFFSFIVFQVVRPRFGFIRKLIARQKEMVESGTLRRD